MSETSKRRPKTLSERLTSRKEVLTAAHPIHLDIEITCEGWLLTRNKRSADL